LHTDLPNEGYLILLALVDKTNELLHNFGKNSKSSRNMVSYSDHVSARNYLVPEPPGLFYGHVWPMHLKHNISKLSQNFLKDSAVRSEMPQKC